MDHQKPQSAHRAWADPTGWSSNVPAVVLVLLVSACSFRYRIQDFELEPLVAAVAPAAADSDDGTFADDATAAQSDPEKYFAAGVA